MAGALFSGLIDPLDSARIVKGKSRPFLWVDPFPGGEDDKHLTTAGWVGFGLFFVSLAVAVFLVPHPAKRYRCKLCGRNIQAIPFDETPKREHRFRCPDCDVVWTTGVYDET
jgi:DNA-directed RNA polymerase subunit RPC12/RpoP